MDFQLAEKPRHRPGLSIDRGVLEKLEERLGRLHARQRLGIEGAEALPTSPDEYAADIAAEETKWSEIIRRSGMKAE